MSKCAETCAYPVWSSRFMAATRSCDLIVMDVRNTKSFGRFTETGAGLGEPHAPHADLGIQVRDCEAGEKGLGNSTEHPDMWDCMQVKSIEARRHSKQRRPCRNQANEKACRHVVRTTTTQVLINDANTYRESRESRESKLWRRAIRHRHGWSDDVETCLEEDDTTRQA